jgi:hypothetical protein
MKKIKKALVIALFFSIGLTIVYLYSLRVKQVNDKPINQNSYYEYEMSNK